MDLLTNIPKINSLTDTPDWAHDPPAYDEEGVPTNESPERVQSLAPLDDPYCLGPLLHGPPPSLDNEHLSDLFPEKSLDHDSEQVLSLSPLDDLFCLSPQLDGRLLSLDYEHLSNSVPDESFDYDFETSETVRPFKQYYCLYHFMYILFLV